MVKAVFTYEMNEKETTNMMNDDHSYRRGDIYLANLDPFFGSEQGGTRPVLVLQNNTGNIFCPTLIVAPLTSRFWKKKSQPTHCQLENVDGLGGPSTVLLEQIKTIDKRRVQKYIGKLHRSQMREVEDAMEISLGLRIAEDVEAP
jgi:mRNA interferase MazF